MTCRQVGESWGIVGGVMLYRLRRPLRRALVPPVLVGVALLHARVRVDTEARHKAGLLLSSQRPRAQKGCQNRRICNGS